MGQHNEHANHGHGHTQEISQTADQSATVDTTQDNSVGDISFSLDLSGWGNHANLNHASFDFTVDVTQANDNATDVEQGAGVELVAATVTDHHGVTTDITQDVTQTADVQTDQSNSVGDIGFSLDVSGGHNHVNLNHASFDFSVSVDQSNTNETTVGQYADIWA
jgi:hypothetical protein